MISNLKGVVIYRDGEDYRKRGGEVGTKSSVFSFKLKMPNKHQRSKQGVWSLGKKTKNTHPHTHLGVKL